jgi:hypothetical protein
MSSLPDELHHSFLTFPKASRKIISPEKGFKDIPSQDRWLSGV